MRRVVLCTAVVGASYRRVATGSVPPSLNVPTTDVMDWDTAKKRRSMVQFINPDGTPVSNAVAPTEEELPGLQRVLATMIRVHAMDKVLLDAQRQGRLSFYMTSIGEEATAVATAEALSPDDEAYLQYREVGFCLQRGMTVPTIVSQCMGNVEDPHKGRQMPVHYGSAELHIQMISSPLGTQIPQAAGAGYGMRIGHEARVTVCFMGEGAASEGDFHAGLNFAATLRSNTMFIVRNNGFAISTPLSEQFHVDGVVDRAAGYGIPSLRVDGNDALAVVRAVSSARTMMLKEATPTLIEMMTYRASHHSTSDDSTRYRAVEEIDAAMKVYDPIARLEKLLMARGVWTRAQSDSLTRETTELCRSELQRQESLPPWPAESMVDDVFAEPTPHLRKQLTETLEHYARHKDKYNATGH